MALGFRIYSKSWEVWGSWRLLLSSWGEAKTYKCWNKLKHVKGDIPESPYHDGRARRGQLNGSTQNHLRGQSEFIVRSSSFSETSTSGQSGNCCPIRHGWASWPSAPHHPSEGDWGQTEFPLSSCFLELPSPSWRLPAPSVKNRKLAVLSCKCRWGSAQSLLPMRC